MTFTSPENNPYGGHFSTQRVRPSVDIQHSWLSLQIVTCALFARHDLDGQCFLKVDDCKPMKSECVSEYAPQAVIGDWRFQGWDDEDE